MSFLVGSRVSGIGVVTGGLAGSSGEGSIAMSISGSRSGSSVEGGWELVDVMTSVYEEL